MRLEQLKYVIEIYHTHSLSQAAKNLALSQPSLSNALAALEEEWGVKLFHRLTTGVIPTEAGERIIPMINASMNDLMRQLSAVSPQLTQTKSLNIMAVPAICSTLLPSVIAAFHQQHPTVSINVLEVRPEIFLSTLAQAQDYLGINAYDQAVESAYRLQAESMDFVLESLYIDRFICCVSPSSPLIDVPNLSRADLSHSVALHFAALFDNTLAIADSIFPYELYQSPYAIGADSLESLKKLVTDNVGVTVIPRSALYHDPYLETGRLVPLLFEQNNLTFHHHLITPQKHLPSPVEEDFLHQLRQAYSEMSHYFATHPL